MTETDKAFFASAWFKSRPKAVQDTFRKYQSKPLSIEGFEEPHFLVGVTENVENGRCGLWVSTTTMEQDYDRAMATRFKVCECCLKRVHIPIP